MFGYGIDKKTLYIIFAVLIVLSLATMTKWEWINILLTLPAVIIAITFHEFAHAKAADMLGDKTPRNQGRLTLNPMAHLEPFGFILLMFAHIGWGRPVQINPNNFNSNKSRSFCESMVSLAGPLMNFIIAIISCIAYVLAGYFASQSFLDSVMGQGIMLLLYMLMTINIGLGVFNLIPLSPLDGEKIFRNLLPYKVQDWLIRNYQTLYLVFLVLWIFGFLGMIVSPVISAIINVLMNAVQAVVLLFV